MAEQEKRLRYEERKSLRDLVDFVNLKELTKKEIFDIKNEGESWILLYFN